MTDVAQDEPQGAETDAPTAPAPRSRLAIILGAVCLVALLLIAGTAGWLLRGHDSHTSVASSSVDAGFARDMSTHHTQAVAMAAYEYRNTTNATLKLIASDILTAQQLEIGRMQGWLDVWNLPFETTKPQMLWMGHDFPQGQLMPGMASQVQLSKLYTLTGQPMDIMFLQLMIHHHQGGIPMAQYAADHAKQSYVRRLASQMVYDQSAQIIDMEKLLRQLGGQTLPPPTL
jgi:uncharacterized protein (DUF305 family)